MRHDDFQGSRDSTVLGDESVRIDHDLVKYLRAARRPWSGVGVSYKDQIEAARQAESDRRAAHNADLQRSAREVLAGLAEAAACAYGEGLYAATLKCPSREVALEVGKQLREDGVVCTVSEGSVVVDLPAVGVD